MKRITRIMAGLGIAAAVTLSMGTPASGTVGFFQYTKPGGGQSLLENPRSNVCHTIAGNGHAYNGTDKTVALFSRNDCEGTPTGHLKRNQHAADVEFESVEFIR
ncbi:hypothetical protein AB0I22_27230 [Streptomyces sp. NPDC050610]|uniref:hypothetical protein n=1 Tax=Streptomyces sp. NPDC050610 TaxID=3157097 RepID=UPI003422E08E